MKRKKAIKIIIIIFALILALIVGVAIYYIKKASDVVNQISGAEYKIDNMVVVVRSEDSANSLGDTKNYAFGIQKDTGSENTRTMVEKINSELGFDVHTVETEDIFQEAQALLNGEVDAAVYNEAMTTIIDEMIEDYSSKVKIIYHYEIQSKVLSAAKETDGEGETGEKKDNGIGSFQVYISGIDVEGPISTTSRSDVNIIATVNTNTKQVLLTTTPRDYYVTIPNISGDQRDKLTHAGIYGVDASIATLNQLFGVAIDYYVRVNFTSLVKIIDTLGGIDVNSDYEFTARGCSFVKGMNHMDGAQALVFSRERYAFEDGDNQRGKNQELVIGAIISKVTSAEGIAHAADMISEVGDSLETNMGQMTIIKLIQLQMKDASSWHVVSTAATGSGDNQACYSSGSQLLYVMWPNEDSVAEISEKMKQVEAGEILE